MAWTEEQVLADQGVGETQYGFSISASGDGNTMVVGAPRTYVQAFTTGKAYVYSKVGSSWTLVATLAPANVEVNEFGYSVSISEDGNVIAVGAIDDEFGGSGGATYMYVKTGDTWPSSHLQRIQHNTSGARSGCSVSLSANGTYLAIGAYLDNSGRGSVSTFVREGTYWTHMDYIDHVGSSNSWFGASVSVSTDSNYLIIGASQETDPISGTNTGGAYIYARTGNAWSQQSELSPSDGHFLDFFGGSVSINATGTTAVVGSIGSSFSGNDNLGQAYIFTRSGTIWTQIQKLTSGQAPVDQYGCSVSVSDTGSIIVGARAANSPSVDSSGTAFAYTRSGSSWTLEQQLSASVPAPNAGFGVSVAVSSDGKITGIGSYAATPAAYIFTSGPLAPDITGITKVGANPSCSYPSNGTCASSRQYVAVVADDTIIDSYTWSVTNNATITSGQGTSNVTVSTDADSNQTITVTCQVANETGTDSLAINDTHTKTLAKPNIVSIVPNGNTPFCEYPAGGECQTFRDYTVVTSDPGGVSSYTWSVSGNATISGGQGTTVVTIVVVSGDSEVINITCVAANPTGSDSFVVADTHERVLEPAPGSPVIPGPLAFEAIPTISTISPAYGTGIAITATEVNKIISGINDVWADTNESTTNITSASMGYGQVSDIPLVSATAKVDNDDWNGMFAAVDKMAKHQGVAKPVELPLRVEDNEDIAAYSSLIPTINVLRTNKMAYDVSQMSSTTDGVGTKSTRTTLWTGSVTHSYDVTFGSWDDMRYFFNTGGELRFSASRSGGTTNSQNTAMSNLLTAIGTGKLAYNQTLRDDNLPANDIGFYDLTETYQTIYLGTGSEAFAGDSYNVEAKLNGTAGATNAIGIRVTMSETAGDPGIDGTTISNADYQIADSTEVSVPVPIFTTTDNL